MKKILNLLGVSLLFLLIGTVNVFSRDLEEARYNKNIIVSRTTIINIPKSTAGTIYYKLPKGSYRIEITSLDKKSTMHLDDCIVNSIYNEDEFLNNAIGPYSISTGHYKFKVKNVDSKTKYKHGFKTTLTSGKLYIRISKIK